MRRDLLDVEVVTHGGPHGIVDAIAALDAESVAVLESIKALI